MIVIADNLNVRNKIYLAAVESKHAEIITKKAQELAQFSDIINVQCSLDGNGDEENLPWAAETIERATDRMVCLDSRNIEALKKAFTLLKKPPLVNYLSQNEPEDRDGLLSLVARERAYLVLRASRGSIPVTFEGKLQILEELLQAANSADIPNERLFLDPSVVHMARDSGQEHLVNSREALLSIKEMIEPPVNSIVWVSNVSVGMPKEQRKATEAAFLLYFAGAGLDAAMVDVLDHELKKSLYFIKSFKDEVVFTPADLALHA